MIDKTQYGSAETDTVLLNELKVMIFGDSGTVRNEILEWLMRAGKDPWPFIHTAKPSRVVQDQRYKIAGRDVLLHFWDCGGLDVLQTVDRLFMTERTVYVVVVNGWEERCEERARHWLRLISHAAKDCAVMLVVDQLRGGGKQSFAGERLLRVYPNLKKIICVKEQGQSVSWYYETFTEPLLELIGHDKALDIRIPRAWDNVRHQIRAVDQPHISADEFAEILMRCGVRDVSAYAEMMRCFCDTGVVAYYDDSSGPSSYVVLDSGWISSAAARILFLHLTNRRDGRATHLQIRSALHELIKGSPEAREVEFILSILRKAGLSSRIDGGSEFIPVHCTLPMPVYVEERMSDPKAMEIRMEYQDAASTVLHQLMIDLRQDLDLDQVWKNSAVFEQRSSGFSALVVSKDHVLQIFLHGADSRYQPHVYLNYIRKALEKIHERLGLAQPEVMIAYRYEGQTEYFDYDMLEMLQGEGQTATYARMFRKMIPISDILGRTDQRVEQDRKKLLEDMAAAFVSMQCNRLMWNASEDERSSVLRDILRMKGYAVHDQTPRGFLGRRSGELDLTILRDRDQPWAACNFLRVRNRSDLRSWNSHLERLLTHFNTGSLPILFLVSYVECGIDEYHGLWNVYNKHMRQYRPESGQKIGTYQHVYPQAELEEYLRIAQCSYDIGGTAVTVYHYFVYMAGDVGWTDNAERTDRRSQEAIRLELASARIAELDQALTQEKAARSMAEDAVQNTKKELAAMMEKTVSEQKEIAALHAMLEQRQEENNDAAVENVRLQEKLKSMSAEYANLQNMTQRAQMLAKDAMNAEQRTRMQLDTVEQAAAARAAENEDLRSRVKELSQRCEQLRTMADQQRTEASLNVAQLEQIADLDRALCRAEADLAQAKAAAADAMEEQQKLAAQLAEANAKQREALQEEANARAAYAQIAADAAEKTALIARLEEQIRQALQERDAALAKATEDQDEEDEKPEVLGDDPDVETEYRVIIMGDSEAGKSQILRRLRFPHKDPKRFNGNVTDGIDIASRIYTIKDKRVRVNFWDFGGQEILHSMHRLFLAENTMYVIVLNTRNDNQDEQARFWLRYVQVYAKGAPVMLVMNKVDQNPTACLNMRVLLREFQDVVNITDVLKLSARDWDEDRFRQTFTERLLEQIEQTLGKMNSFNEQERRIRSRIRNWSGSEDFVDMEDFGAICKRESLHGDEAHKILANRFHRAGIIVYFETRTMIVLNPEWVTKAIYKMVDRREHFESSGIVRCALLESVLYDASDGKFKKRHVDFVLKIMRRYGLSYQYHVPSPGEDDSEELEFIPMLCRREEPAEIEAFLDREDVIQMQLVFKFLPASVLYQLMVRKWQTLDTQNVWLSGAMFRSDTSTAVVRREQNRLNIYVCGADRNQVLQDLSALRTFIRDITREPLHNTNIEETLIGYRVSGKTEFFDYDRLEKAKGERLEYVMSKHKPGLVAVADILEQEDHSAQRNINNLLRLTIKGCETLQMDQTFWFQKRAGDADLSVPKMDENARNRLLKLILERSFIVYDQPQGGESSKGTNPGELDLLVHNNDHSPLAIVEALNISSTTGDSRKRWLEHLQRVAVHYNKMGLRCLVLVSYLHCKEDKFDEVRKAYDNLLRDTAMEHYGVPVRCEPAEQEKCPERLHIMRADYAGKIGVLSVYHFLVHIPVYTPEKKTDAVPAV